MICVIPTLRFYFRQACKRLGHSNITITLDTYSHVLLNMQQTATDKLEAILFTAPETNQEASLTN